MNGTTIQEDGRNHVHTTPESTNYINDLTGIFLITFGAVVLVIVITLIVVVIKRYRCMKRGQDVHEPTSIFFGNGNNGGPSMDPCGTPDVTASDTIEQPGHVNVGIEPSTSTCEGPSGENRLAEEDNGYVDVRGPTR